MHMKSAPHLLAEDRPEYERILADALRHAHERPDLDGVGDRLNAEQLRTMALNATPLITAAAATEYDHYVKVRGELRGPGEPDAATSVLGSTTDEADPAGAGTLAVIAVLAPVLAGTAALIFLVVGYPLKALSPAPAFAGTMVAAGWFFAAVAAAAILVAAVGLLVTALRNGATALPAVDEEEELPEDVARAREAWRHALLERGILPFLRDALADPTAGPASRTPHRSANRIPKIGYSRPDFSGPEDGPSAGPRPTFTSPDFTSPDFGGPEHQPE
ncbi:hypothetical protein PV394_18025 [Streptomyces sp. NE06-03E]|uniref:Transmembrane protein n=3 Tax=Streptomyces TaxID=1883 RepID=A0AAU1LUD2_9ACTN|nr:MULTISPECIES: hypothetical protein [unclassified Streptomyces]WSS63029.1 hypothetical protein OG284_18225 [Streptomyces sp. NBC_01177]WSS70044.1 hypothetical protein OG491_17945 [Streptomyces sp. NBC_01175]WSS77060.1 hypothetical protein OG414_18290 [Streptomyces sp. NBC_01174]MDX3057025.1 hypothetical protein [Streptomyces sp. NE06-03E]MDX3323638.1 hypothetical protein [Streptomyces sp. ME02-6979-3A]